MEPDLYSQIEVGKEFQSHEELVKVFNDYQKKNYVQLNRRHTRTIKSALKRNPNKSYNPRIEFTEIDFHCNHGGKTFESKSEGIRVNHR